MPKDRTYEERSHGNRFLPCRTQFRNVSSAEKIRTAQFPLEVLELGKSQIERKKIDNMKEWICAGPGVSSIMLIIEQ